MPNEMRHADLPDELNDLTRSIVGAAIELHKALGPGLLERVCQEGLAHLLRERGHSVAMEVPIRAVLDGHDLGIAFRADMEVDGKVLVEVKSVAELADVHMAQMWTYLKLSDRRVGLLINFNERYVRDGIRRVARPPSVSP